MDSLNENFRRRGGAGLDLFRRRFEEKNVRQSK